jgi:hypothetical protein
MEQGIRTGVSAIEVPTAQRGRSTNWRPERGKKKAAGVRTSCHLVKLGMGKRFEWVAYELRRSIQNPKITSIFCFPA